MSWNYIFIIELDGSENASERFLDIVDTVSQSTAFDHALPIKLEVTNEQQHTSDLNLGKRGARDDALGVFRRLADEHYQEDVRYSLTYQMPLYVQLWEDEIPAKQKNYRQFIVQGYREFGVPTELYYNAGDARHYRSGRTQQLNLGLLMKELLFIAQEMRARTIRGLNIHNDVEAHRHSVVFHRELDGFLLDLYTITGEHHGLTDRTREIALDAMFDPRANLRLEETDDLPILVSKDGSTGDLRAFYEILLHLLREKNR
ncbi:hypothetical protein G4Y79_10335 [Phototrophicus methaneseepsis]|uniref:Uncharacterized protein n=1 Tax=Phototrophicus methaneseepsis TaxID=2710758 RepID=A0A7S8IGG7_9CHLR|nr:hypothetical protein [Phototrophicus methaneseepsis]QPC84751.1 hypothetical protein G4Y79_10335 [Phototrophicus methaneseepsis]